ncbi:MAG TPA: RecQ family ATP-dependent DNA helicase [Spirochaetia bacterium]|jgi:ATP-dependent DNA helicase RecQ|nr:RecQ family ATP-dependent DNA helicase [Spirochaetia bacterium]
MDPRVVEALKSWGIPALFPYQDRVITALLTQERVRQAVVLPTGAGKSLCFQLPAALFPHPTLVVYPLRSLTADQRRRAEAAGLATAVLQGGQTRGQRRQVWDRLASGSVKLLLSNPETLAQPRVLDELKRYPLSHAVVDEAHCVELWGNSFRPGYRTLGPTLAELEVPRLTAFTATATGRVVEDWKQTLFSGEPFELVRASADRPNLDFSREPYLSLRKSLPRAVLREARPMVIFCRSREQVRRWAHHLHRETALEVRFYHAGLSREEKTALEGWFFASANGVLVATNAYGMGVDKSNIRTVFHLEDPPGPEDYLQEAGRAGRDGKPAKAILFRRALAFPEPAPCRRADLLRAFGEPAPPCGGCDVCRGQDQVPHPDAGPALTRLLPLVHRGDREDCQAFLAGRRPPRLWESDLPQRPGWGLWAGEDDLTVRELWRGLEEGGWVRFHRHGPWKGLLAPLAGA